MPFACDEAYENRGKYFPLKGIGHMTTKLTIFFDFSGLFVTLA